MKPNRLLQATAAPERLVRLWRRPGRGGRISICNQILRSSWRRRLKLSPEARAALAASLLESLDEGVDEDVEAVWAAEIARRIQELDSGAVIASAVG